MTKKPPSRREGSKGTTSNQDSEPEEILDLDEAIEVIPFTYSITSYGADYPVDALVSRMKSGDIVVPRFSWEPDEGSKVVGFQREYVWPRTKADRFIESLLLGLPVPGIFLVKEATGRFLVLDGHQRLYTLAAFYDGVINGVEYRLENVQTRFLGKRHRDLDVEDRRRLDDSIVHATVVRQDEPSEDQSSIYVIFERLNSGGVNLQPQEIRVALYNGELVRVLRTLNGNPAWRRLIGHRVKRLKDMEMILRFFAFYYYSATYRSPMKDFLNRYMSTNRNLTRQSEAELTNVFEKTTETIVEHIGDRAFRPARPVNAAVIDSLMTGVARRLAAGPLKRGDQLAEQYDVLLANQDYRKAVETGTSQEQNVKTRIDEATKRRRRSSPSNDWQGPDPARKTEIGRNVRAGLRAPRRCGIIVRLRATLMCSRLRVPRASNHRAAD